MKAQIFPVVLPDLSKMKLSTALPQLRTIAKFNNMDLKYVNDFQKCVELFKLTLN